MSEARWELLAVLALAAVVGMSIARIRGRALRRTLLAIWALGPFGAFGIASWRADDSPGTGAAMLVMGFLCILWAGAAVLGYRERLFRR